MRCKACDAELRLHELDNKGPVTKEETGLCDYCTSFIGFQDLEDSDVPDVRRPFDEPEVEADREIEFDDFGDGEAAND